MQLKSRWARREDRRARNARLANAGLGIKVLGLTPRVENALIRGGLATADDLRALSIEDLAGIRNLGVRGLSEIQQVLGPLAESSTLGHELSARLSTLHGLGQSHLNLANTPITKLPLSDRALELLQRLRLNTLGEFVSGHIPESMQSEAPAACLSLIRALDEFILKSERDLARTAPKGSQTGFANKRPRAIDRHVAIEIQRLRKLARGVEASRDDPRLGLLIRNVDQTALNLADLYQVLGKVPARSSIDITKIKGLAAELAAVSELRLEDELKGLLHTSLVPGKAPRPVRERMALAYLGWDGNGPRTLDAVGNEFGVSRERVRQVVGSETDHLKSVRPFAPALEAALKYVARRLPGVASDIEENLSNESISREAFRVEGILSAADLLHRRANFRIGKVGSIRVILPLKPPNIEKTISVVSRKAIEHWGAATIDDIAARLLEEQGVGVQSDFLSAALPDLTGFRWLSKEDGWFWLADVPRNRLQNVIEKILSIAPHIHVSDLRRGVGRHHRMEGYAPPRRVLLELCRQTTGYRVNGDTINADPPRDWETVLSPTERTFAQILTQRGPIMSRSALEDECLAAGMNRSTFYVYLEYSPVLERLDRGVYGLRGVSVTPGEVEALAPKIVRRKVLKDYGWTPDIRPWLAYSVSESMVQSGVFGTPSALKKLLDGEFSLVTATGSHMGSLVFASTGSWGLGPFFRRRGVEPGDYLLLVFDLQKRQATAWMGERSLLEGADEMGYPEILARHADSS
jgi:hypothetical protein